MNCSIRVLVPLVLDLTERFEHLEHIDDDLSWGGLQSAASAAIKPLRPFRHVAG